MKRILSLALLPVLGVFCSCSSRIGDFTLISTKSVDMNHPAGYYKKAGERVTGEDKANIIVIVPTRIVDVKSAVDNTIEKAGADCVAISDAVIETRFWWVPYIYGQNQIQVKGTPIYKIPTPPREERGTEKSRR